MLFFYWKFHWKLMILRVVWYSDYPEGSVRKSNWKSNPKSNSVDNIQRVTDNRNRPLPRSKKQFFILVFFFVFSFSRTIDSTTEPFTPQSRPRATTRGFDEKTNGFSTGMVVGGGWLRLHSWDKKPSLCQKLILDLYTIKSVLTHNIIITGRKNRDVIVVGKS